MVLGLLFQASQAIAQRNPYDAFEQFREPLLERATRSYRACVQRETSAAALRNCNRAEHRRQERQLRRAYRAALARLSESRRDSLQDQQREWLLDRNVRCRPGGVTPDVTGRSSYFVVGNECALLEVIRRTWWLQRYR
jgi:uncharacterized protein YecT (DUF1311 family)